MNIQFFKDYPTSCSYLSDELSQSLIVDPNQENNPRVYDIFLQNGFRRSGNMIYRPDCPSCQKCKPIRLAIKDFKPRRNQRRVLTKNKDISIQRVKPILTDEQFSLYQAYTQVLHEEGGMANASFQSTSNFFGCEWGMVEFLEYRLQDRLIGLAVTDIMPTSLSAMYTLFDPTLRKRSLGVFSILMQLEQCKKRGLSHLYLGYWIKECQKMAYKQEYRPAEIFNGDHWHQLDV